MAICKSWISKIYTRVQFWAIYKSSILGYMQEFYFVAIYKSSISKIYTRVQFWAIYKSSILGYIQEFYFVAIYNFYFVVIYNSLISWLTTRALFRDSALHTRFVMLLKWWEIFHSVRVRHARQYSDVVNPFSFWNPVAWVRSRALTAGSVRSTPRLND